MSDTNTSATGGPLAPLPPAVEDDRPLEDFLQSIIVGITGLPGPMVRPRWQPEPPALPPRGTDWAAIGIVRSTPDVFAFERHVPIGDGDDEFQRHEVFDLECSFYGPNADEYADLLRDGLAVAQNREPLFLVGIGVVQSGIRTRAPILLKEKWLKRSDLTVTLRREIRRTYPVLTVLKAGGTLVDDTGASTTFEAGT